MEQSCHGTFNEQSRNFPGWNKKVKFTCHEEIEEARRYSSTLSLTPAIDGGGWSTPHPCSFTHLVPPLQEGVGTIPGLDGCRKPVLTGTRSPDHPFVTSRYTD
jgi:hypothetical protein